MQGDACPICLETMAPSSLWLSCGHSLHAGCLLETWQGGPNRNGEQQAQAAPRRHRWSRCLPPGCLLSALFLAHILPVCRRPTELVALPLLPRYSGGGPCAARQRAAARGQVQRAGLAVAQWPAVVCAEVHVQAMGCHIAAVKGRTSGKPDL